MKNMKSKTCRDLRCPRLMMVDGVPHCNQWQTDSPEYYKRTDLIGDEECLELRRQLREARRGRRPWQE